MVHLNSSLKRTRGEKPILKRIIKEADLRLTVALTDSSRRRIIELLNESEQGLTAKELAQELDLKISTVMSHLKILRAVDAVTSEKRTGKSVKRSLNRYYSLVQVRTAEQIDKATKEAVEAYSDYLIGSTFSFLTEKKEVVPKTLGPYDLAEWLDALISEASESLAEEVVFLNTGELVKHEMYRRQAAYAAKIMLFNDFAILMHNYAIELFEKNPNLINKIAREHGFSEIRSGDDLSFVVESLLTILYGPSDDLPEVKKLMREILRVLPRGRQQKMIKYWSSVLEAVDLPISIRDKIMRSLYFGDESEILERCDGNLKIIKSYGE